MWVAFGILAIRVNITKRFYQNMGDLIYGRCNCYFAHAEALVIIRGFKLGNGLTLSGFLMESDCQVLVNTLKSEAEDFSYPGDFIG